MKIQRKYGVNVCRNPRFPRDFKGELQGEGRFAWAVNKGGTAGFRSLATGGPFFIL